MVMKIIDDVDEMNGEDWDKVIMKGKHYLRNNLFCKKKNKEIISLIDKWDEPGNKMVLVTDLFEDALVPKGIFEWLQGRYQMVFGIDISKETIKSFYRDRNLNAKRCLVCDVREISFKNNSFDLIVSDSTLDHFKNIESALTELYRVLRPGGKLILNLNNKFQFFFSLKIWIKKRLNIKDYSYGYSYSLSYAYELLKRIGFDIDESTYLYFFPPFLKFFIPKQNNKILQFYERWLDRYNLFVSKNKYLNIFTGSNFAIKAFKKK